MTFRRLPALAGVAVAVALAIAACGSSGKPSHSAGLNQGLKFADCMRSHGLTNFPDPVSGGGLALPSTVNPTSPGFQAAQKACQSLMPGGGPGSRPSATAEQRAAMVHLSECMRAHGVSGFPDPVSSPPSNPTGFALAFGRPGAFMVIPDTLDMQSPTFKQAAQACQFPGAGRPKASS